LYDKIGYLKRKTDLRPLVGFNDKGFIQKQQQITDYLDGSLSVNVDLSFAS